MTIEKLLLPVGRIVWGNPAVVKPKVNYNNKQPIIGKDGKQVEAWEFGLAIPKAEFDAQVWPQLWAEAHRLYPNGVPRDYSWKITDGDGMDKNNKPYSAREGYAGCRILNISTQAFAPPIYKYENGAYRRMDANEIKCGDYVAVQINVLGHNEKDGGLYLNPNMIEFVGYGTQIVSRSEDPMEAFGGRQHQLPPGASATPISSAPVGVGMPGAPVQQPYAPPASAQGVPAAPMQQQPYAPPAAAPMPMQPAQLPPPAHDFVNNAGNYPPAYAPPAAAPHQPVQQYAGPVTTSPINGMPPAR